MRPFRGLGLSKILMVYKNSAIFQAFLCPTLPSKRPPESVGERPRIINLVPANVRRDAAHWIHPSDARRMGRWTNLHRFHSARATMVACTPRRLVRPVI